MNFEGPDFIEILYAGYVGVHVVLSPRRFVQSYGLHTGGDRFKVHVEDQKAAPTLFQLIPPEPVAEPVSAPEPETAPVVEPVAEVVPQVEQSAQEVTQPVSPTEASPEA